MIAVFRRPVEPTMGWLLTKISISAPQCASGEGADAMVRPFSTENVALDWCLARYIGPIEHLIVPLITGNIEVKRDPAFCHCACTLIPLAGGIPCENS